MHRRVQVQVVDAGRRRHRGGEPALLEPSVKPLVQQILLKGVPDASTFTSGMLTGGIQGSYPWA